MSEEYDSVVPMAEDVERVLDRVRDEWKELRGARLFLTGATGFIGCWLLETFLAANRRLALGAEAVVLTRRPDAFRRDRAHLAGDAAVRLVEGDVRRFEFPAGAFSHVVHGAVDSTQAPAEFTSAILEGTRRTLEFCRARGVRRLLLLSTGAVYGPQPAAIERLSESHACVPAAAHPRGAYGEAKRQAEAMCTAERATEAVIARGFAFVGPYLPVDTHYAIGNFIRDGLKGGPIVVNSDGSSVRSYLYASDMAAWLWAILLRGGARQAYNVGSEDAITIGDLARAAAEAFEEPLEVVIRGGPVPGAPVDRYVPSTQRARTELGLTQTCDLREALRRTIAWHRASRVEVP